MKGSLNERQDGAFALAAARFDCGGIMRDINVVCVAAGGAVGRRHCGRREWVSVLKPVRFYSGSIVVVTSF